MNSNHDSQQSLEARLRLQARTMRVTPPDGLEQRISAAVWREREAGRGKIDRPPQRRSFRFLSPAVAGLLTSACAVALVVLWSDRVREEKAREADIRYLVDTVEALPARLAAAELPVSRTISVVQPLTREIEAMRQDARSALGFLAANFLPSASAAANDGQAAGLDPSVQES